MPTKPQPGARYHAYLLRFWQAEVDQPWRASLEDPHTGTTRRFASMQALFSFIENFVTNPPSPGSDPEEGKEIAS